MLRSPLAILLIFLVIVTLIPAPAAADESRHLTNNGEYYQGTVVTHANYGPPNSNVTIYEARSDTPIMNLTLNESGGLTLDTDTLPAANPFDQYVVDGPNSDDILFSIYYEDHNATQTKTYLADNPPETRIVVDVNVENSHQIPITLHISTPNNYGFSDRVLSEHATRVDYDRVVIDPQGPPIVINYSDLPPSRTRLHIDNPLTGEHTNLPINYDANYTTPILQTQPVSVERGGEYWRPSTLVATGLTPNQTYTVETLEGNQVYQHATTTNGQLYIDTTGFDSGIYRILHNNTEATRFELRVQTINATATTDELVLKSNRPNYDATIRVYNDTRNLTTTALEGASENHTKVTNLTTNTKVNLNTSSFAPGNYTISIQSSDSNTSTTASFSVTTTTTTTTTTNSISASSTQSTTTPDTKTSTQHSETTTTTSKTTTASSPGFGAIAALVGLLLAGLLVREKNIRSNR